MDDVIVGHGISLLRWRSGGVKHPHDMPPFRFPPSPTLGDSSPSQSPSTAPTDKDAQTRSEKFLIPPGEPAAIRALVDGNLTPFAGVENDGSQLGDDVAILAPG